MSSNAKTRKIRVAAGKCSACLRRARTPGHATCAPCRRRINERSVERYADRRARGVCTRCEEPADGYLCATHAGERYDQQRRRD